jgi:hypothetical protein
MADEPRLIARLQVGLSASGECSVCGEVIIVNGPNSKPEQIPEMLQQAFEEHVVDRDVSEKPIRTSGNLD